MNSFFCDLSVCTTCDLEFRNSVCCCRVIEEEIIQAECNTTNPSSVRNATRCGCTSCDDIEAMVQVTVVSVEDNTPIPAAQILQANTLVVLGITLTDGQFVFQEPLGTRSITIRVQAPDFLPRSVTILLEPGRTVIAVTVPLIPLLVLPIGLGGSAVTVRLGPAAVSTPARAFRTNGTDEPYDDLVTFRGVFLDAQNGLAGLPSTTFEYLNANGTMELFGSVLVTFISFQDINDAALTAEGLRMTLSLPDIGGTLLDNEIFLVVYDEASDTWNRVNDFQAVNIPGVQKRQDEPVVRVLEAPDIPLEVFLAVAMDVNANCWIQARTFSLTGGEFSGTFVRLEQTSSISGNQFMYRFGTITGGAQTTVDGLAQNAVCLPLACENFTSAVVEARVSFNPDTSTSLIPVDFPADTFTAMENAPIVIGDMFSIESVILRNGPLPFYPNLAMCRANGMESLSQSDDREFFSFNSPNETIHIPAEGPCYIKLLIRGCFPNNLVIVRSVNSDGIIESTVTDLVPEVEELFDSSTGQPLPRIPCNASNATPRGVCLPFNCSETVVVLVQQNPDSPIQLQGLCNLMSLAPTLSPPIISGSSGPQQLVIDTSILLMTDYNDPDIGLYHDDVTPQIARARCNAGNGDIAAEIDILAGYAAAFTCFLN